jgi:flagellar biosynthesis chaperone FliJ
MAAFKFAAVLRARHAQEDVAKAAVVRARAEASAAAVRVRAVERDLDGRAIPDASSAAAFIATMSARNALASALCAAIGTRSHSDEGVQQHIEDLTGAAVQRRTIEKLEERHTAARRRVEDAIDARAVDDLTTSAHSRRTEETHG